MDARDIENIAARLASVLPPGLAAVRRELEDNFRAVLQSSLERLDLVSRERFEAQAALLARTRAKLEALEQRLAELERRLDGSGDQGQAAG